MLTYHYIARNPSSGEKVKATIQAENELAAAKSLRKEGLVPLDIYTGSKNIFDLNGKLQRINVKDKVLFSRQLSTLINAGLPIIQALRSVGEQTTSKHFKVIINEIVANVEAGSALSVAMSKYPKVFNQVYIALIQAGETSGTLDTTLERLAVQQEKDADVMGKVRGAMIYPVIVLCVMLAVVAFMLIKVLPQVQILYTTFPGATLPIETKLLLDASHLVIKYWWLFLLIIVILVIVSSRWGRTPTGKRFFDNLKLHAWPVNSLFEKMYMARFARTASTLVGSGVPIIRVLEVTAQAVNNVVVEDAIKRAIEKVKGGKALSDALQGEPSFLELVPNMLRIGEQSGSMEQMLAKVADYYEREVDDAVKNISTIIEPVMMIVLGVMALIIVAAVLLPIYGLAGSGNIQF
jgi:type IV pilus assembly protein PilC